eukprot:9729087-Heterocapsa_arctica.AAC.1
MSSVASLAAPIRMDPVSFRLVVPLVYDISRCSDRSCLAFHFVMYLASLTVAVRKSGRATRAAKSKRM